jgi:spore photoproduct lyase
MRDFNVKTIFQPTHIFIEESVSGLPFTQRIVAKYPHVTQETIQDANELLSAAATDCNKGNWKGRLLLAKQRGPFLRLCPGTKHHLCCLYHNLDVAAGCDLGCSYCILQGYLNNPLITLYCNMDDMFHELDTHLTAHPNQFYRIGSGELTDSLTFEHITELGPELVAFFAERRNAIIELKSKNIHIEGLLGLNHQRRTVVSWSMNAEAVRQSDEGVSASIAERLEAAQEMQSAGYRLGFHFDPMIHFEGWQEGYRETVDRIFRVIQPKNIAWISLGALRYPAAFEDIMRENFPDSRIYLGELLPGIDKKLRYFKHLRIDMFHQMHTWIRSHSRDVFVYLCMESGQVWQNAFGWAPRSSAQLKRLLDEQVKAGR